MKVLETKRFLLRHVTPEDFDNFYRVNSDPLIMKYVAIGSSRTPENQALLY